jgi:hypothetical protein
VFAGGYFDQEAAAMDVALPSVFAARLDLYPQLIFMGGHASTGRTSIDR